jgi:DNA repair exonuclease SbcCD nuclease subunit
MKFAHIADCHIGGWRDPKLRNIAAKAFEKAIDLSIENNVDFILIAGDLFNTSLPSVDGLKLAVKKLKELKDKNIPVYLIAGSHDFSPSGKTMLDVLENAGLFTNVAKGEDVEGKLKLNFTIDKKTNAKITGLLGKKGGLEKSYYEELLKEELEKEQGYKIFLFHSLLSELKPKELEKADSQPLSLLPKNFNYYAGGHPHIVKDAEIQGYGKIAYPGPLFPNNFRELEQLSNGGFYIVEDDKIKFEPIIIYNTHHIQIEANHKTPQQITNEITEQIKGKEFNDTIITIRVSGILESGKPSDINFKDIFEKLYEKSAYFVMKNTNALVAKEFEEIKIDAKDIEDVEEKIIKEHLGQIKVDALKDETAITKELMRILSIGRDEGEKVADFENRVKGEMEKVLELE